MIARFLFLSFATLPLCACASSAQLATNDDPICQSYGAEPGTRAYVQCRMGQGQERAQAVANAFRRVGVGMSCVGASDASSKIKRSVGSAPLIPIAFSVAAPDSP
jgi:hypothetical protein